MDSVAKEWDALQYYGVMHPVHHNKDYFPIATHMNPNIMNYI